MSRRKQITVYILYALFDVDADMEVTPLPEVYATAAQANSGRACKEGPEGWAVAECDYWEE